MNEPNPSDPTNWTKDDLLAFCENIRSEHALRVANCLYIGMTLMSLHYRLGDKGFERCIRENMMWPLDRKHLRYMQAGAAWSAPQPKPAQRRTSKILALTLLPYSITRRYQRDLFSDRIDSQLAEIEAALESVFISQKISLESR